MRKTIAAVTAGLLLVAGQAVAANDSAARVGDRVGARAADSSEFQEGGGLFGMPIGTALIGGAVVIGLVLVATNDESAS
jgi:hypothetical protein